MWWLQSKMMRNSRLLFISFRRGRVSWVSTGSCLIFNLMLYLEGAIISSWSLMRPAEQKRNVMTIGVEKGWSWSCRYKMKYTAVCKRFGTGFECVHLINPTFSKYKKGRRRTSSNGTPHVHIPLNGCNFLECVVTCVLSNLCECWECSRCGLRGRLLSLLAKHAKKKTKKKLGEFLQQAETFNWLINS